MAAYQSELNNNLSNSDEMLIIRYYFEPFTGNDSGKLELCSSKENIKEIEVRSDIKDLYVTYFYSLENGFFFNETTVENFNQIKQSGLYMEIKRYNTSLYEVEDISSKFDKSNTITGLLHFRLTDDTQSSMDTTKIRFNYYGNKFYINTFVDFDGVKELKVPFNQHEIYIMKVGGYDSFDFEFTTPEIFQKELKIYMDNQCIEENNEDYEVKYIEYTNDNLSNVAIDNSVNDMYHITETKIYPDYESCWFSLIKMTKK